MTSLWAAVVQMQSSGDLEANKARAHRLIAEAANRGARLVALPEYCLGLGPPETIVAQARALDGPVVQSFCRQAQELGLYLLLGTIPEPAPETGKVYNSSLLLGPDGRILARYRKIHLFDINIPGKVSFQESAHVVGGREVVAVPVPELGWTVGLAICYDLRFPELFRALVERGADLIIVPAAFSQVTGRDHWETLLRARAIENQVYILAPAQYPHPAQSIKTYGRSLIIDPWGLSLARAADQEDIIYARLDRQHLEKIRSELPCLTHRRL
ncbi:MAG: carbon-nitrogen hydrolase family protein [Desulfobacca sp.]|uniref:carbon-nitrogen hydrolase family protein n=1 Tax=Desulfobacca sp. TaxID=2067990 RepID=UPI00404913BD